MPSLGSPCRISLEAEARKSVPATNGLKEGKGSGLIGPYWTMREIANSLQMLEKNGGDDETRTRDLCRDRAAF